MFQENTTTT